MATSTRSVLTNTRTTSPSQLWGRTAVLALTVVATSTGLPTALADSLAMEATPSTNSGMASSSQHSPLAGRPAGAENHEPPATVVRSDQEELLWIKEQSGLTWEQLGRVFGVSRRAVHLWANGGRMNEANARTLRDFASTVQAVSSDSPEMTRAALMSRDADGLSSLDRLRRSNVKRSGETWGSPFLPEYKVAADIGGKDAAE